MSTKDTSQTAL